VADFGERSSSDFCAGTFWSFRCLSPESHRKICDVLRKEFVCNLRWTSYTKINETLSEVKIKQPKLKVGDKVRLSMTHARFRKGYLQGCTQELFVVAKAIAGSPPY